MRDDADLGAVVRALVEEHPPATGSHPSPEELLAYQRRSLAEAEAERIQEHLVSCGECRSMVMGLEAAMSGEPPEGVAPVPDEVVAERWEELRRRQAGVVARVLAALGRALKPPRIAYAVAAASVAVAVGLSLWVAALRSTVADLNRPRVHVVLQDLVPQTEGQRRSEGGGARFSVPEDAEAVLLLLNLADLTPYPGYELEILDSQGRALWTSRGLRRSPDGNFTLELPHSFLPSGRYRLLLFGLSETGRVPLVEYVFELQHE